MATTTTHNRPPNTTHDPLRGVIRSKTISDYVGTKLKARVSLREAKAPLQWFDPQRGDHAIHTAIVEGVEVSRLLRFMRDNKGFSSDELANALRISKRTLTRLADGEGASLDIAQGEGLARLLQAVSLGQAVLGSESAALDWLRKPALGLDGDRPVDLLSTSFGANLVMVLLRRIDQGVYS